jgi:hypothetical protein
MTVWGYWNRAEAVSGRLQRVRCGPISQSAQRVEVKYILTSLHLLQNFNKGELIHANQKCKKSSVESTKLKLKIGGAKYAEE